MVPFDSCSRLHLMEKGFSCYMLIMYFDFSYGQLNFRMLDLFCFFLNLPFLCVQLVMVNPGSEVMKKLNKSKFQEKIGQKWIYLTVEEAVRACNFMLHECKPHPERNEPEGWNNV